MERENLIIEQEKRNGNSDKTTRIGIGSFERFFKSTTIEFPDVDTQVDELQSAVKDQRKLSVITALSTENQVRLPLSLSSYSRENSHTHAQTQRGACQERIADREQSMLSPQMNGVLERTRRNSIVVVVVVTHEWVRRGERENSGGSGDKNRSIITNIFNKAFSLFLTLLFSSPPHPRQHCVRLLIRLVLPFAIGPSSIIFFLRSTSALRFSSFAIRISSSFSNSI